MENRASRKKANGKKGSRKLSIGNKGSWTKMANFQALADEGIYSKVCKARCLMFFILTD
jgi:hypothetical protein